MAAAIAFLADARPVPAPVERFVAGVDRGTALTEAESAAEAHGLTVRRSLPDLHALDVSGTAVDVRAADGEEGITYIEPVRKVGAADSPADQYFGQQSPYLSAVRAQQAWDIHQGTSDVVIAVVDTGLDLTHPDIQPNLWFNPFEIGNNNLDDDGNGCVDDLNGCAFVTDSSPGCQNVANGFVRDDIGHGTFVAGVAAAAANGSGIVGVARNARIMAVKVLDCYGAGDSVAVARGVLYAARNGADVVNLSLGGLADANVLRQAISEAWTQYGVLVVAAAGNSGVEGVAFPARVQEVLAVGAAATSPDLRASFSSYGPEIDVVAVGDGILGPVPPSRCFVIVVCLNENIGRGGGTSFSAPQVSGLVALMLSMRPNLSPEALTEIVTSTSTPLPDGNAPGWAGAGRINMLNAMRAVQANVPAGEACTVASVIDGESFTCTSGRTVRMLQMEAPNLGACGGEWAKAALEFIFLTPGRTIALQFDATQTDDRGRMLAAPIWRSEDGGDYNLSIVMVYVGLARAADIGSGNVRYRDWSLASEGWASVARWNMWADGKPFVGGC